MALGYENMVRLPKSSRKPAMPAPATVLTMPVVVLYMDNWWLPSCVLYCLSGTNALFVNSGASSYGTSMETDGANYYVIDGSATSIRKIVVATGVVTTLFKCSATVGQGDGATGVAKCQNFNGVAYGNNQLYLTDVMNHNVRQLNTGTGILTTLAGSVSATSGATDGTGTSSAKFNQPTGVAVDNAILPTVLYVADFNSNTIRSVVISTGVVTTVVGTAGSAGGTDGVGSNVRLSGPVALQYINGGLYVVELSGHRLRVINVASRSTRTIVGALNGMSGAVDGTGTFALLNAPTDVAVDATETYAYVADNGNHKIRRVLLSSAVTTTLAGGLAANGAAFADGTGTAALFRDVTGVCLQNGGGAIAYVADRGNNLLRSVNINSFVTSTIAGASHVAISSFPAPATAGLVDGVGELSSASVVVAFVCWCLCWHWC